MAGGDKEVKNVKLSPGCIIVLVLFAAFCIFMQLYTHGELGDVRTPGMGR